LGLFAPYTHHSELQVITALQLIYTLYNSPLHIHQGSQSSLVVSWQRVHNSLTVPTHKVFKSHSCNTTNSQLLSLLNHLLPTTDNPSIILVISPLDQKTWFPNNSSIVIEMCLPQRCIETAVLLLLRECLLPREPVYRALA
jgi:hypothetical protein